MKDQGNCFTSSSGKLSLVTGGMRGDGAIICFDRPDWLRAECGKLGHLGVELPVSSEDLAELCAWWQATQGPQPPEKA